MRAYLTCCFLVLISRARAKYFSDWIKADAFGADTKTYVCEMWIRDKNIFDNIGKVSGMGCIIVRLVQCIVDLGPRTGIPHDGQQELDPPTDGVESRRPRPTCFEMGGRRALHSLLKTSLDEGHANSPRHAMERDGHLSSDARRFAAHYTAHPRATGGENPTQLYDV